MQYKFLIYHCFVEKFPYFVWMF